MGYASYREDIEESLNDGLEEVRALSSILSHSHERTKPPLAAHDDLHPDRPFVPTASEELAEIKSKLSSISDQIIKAQAALKKYVDLADILTDPDFDAATDYLSLSDRLRERHKEIDELKHAGAMLKKQNALLKAQAEKTQKKLEQTKDQLKSSRASTRQLKRALDNANYLLAAYKPKPTEKNRGTKQADRQKHQHSQRQS
ncbi:MAG: hypothetical protein JJU33_11320 [Phycisphaerales bacterium]|nr:hypothetical protein [Phycisphaerales bacterium]